MSSPINIAADGADKRAIDDAIVIAQSLLGTAMEPRAETVLGKLVERFPKSARAHLAQADLWRRAGRLGDAAQAVQRALACDSADRRALVLAAALRGRGMPTADGVAIPAPLRLLKEFLPPLVHRQLLDLALRSETRLAPSVVGGINPHADWRRSKVDILPDPFRSLADDAILGAAREAIDAFAMEEFPFETVEMQFTVHNNGDFYKAHLDRGKGGMEHRRLSFVYYFNSQPRAFSGGALALYDLLGDGASYGPQSYSLVEPVDNALIIFPSNFWHEVQKVVCPSGAYGDSRFTLNGWIGVQRLKDAKAGV